MRSSFFEAISNDLKGEENASCDSKFLRYYLKEISADQEKENEVDV